MSPFKILVDQITRFSEIIKPNCQAKAIGGVVTFGENDKLWQFWTSYEKFVCWDRISVGSLCATRNSEKGLQEFGMGEMIQSNARHFV